MRKRRPPSKRFKITEDDLTEENEWGYTHRFNSKFFEIVIDENHRNERERMDTLIHEAIHVGNWYMSERKVIALADIITRVLWRQGYRRRVKSK